MAKKTVFQKIEMTDVDNLDIEDGVYYGICTSSMLDKIATVLVTEEIEKFQEVEELLITETTNKLTILNKGFVLPGCNVSADRIKEAAKEHSITITNDFEAADFIINDGMVQREVYHNDDKYPTSAMLVEFRNGYVIKDKHDVIINYYNDTGCSVFWDGRCNQYWNLSNCEYESAPYHSYVMTGLAIALASKIKSKELEVVEVDTLLNSSANIQILTDQLLSDLEGMLNTGDDREMVGALLPTIDYRQTPALMWKLSILLRGKDYYWPRNKDLKYWWSCANINDLGCMNAEEAVEHYETKGVLDAENFKMLEPLCRKEIHISNRALYVFKVAVSPKWRKYLTNNIKK